jgi:acetyl-CoA C-acetyltransferase
VVSTPWRASNPTIAAVEPGRFGLGPIPAVRQALDRAGWKLGDVERIEINEAFTAIVIAVTRELGLSPDIVNIDGGAIAHGHPIGATSAVLTTRLIHSLRVRARLARIFYIPSYPGNRFNPHNSA